MHQLLSAAEPLVPHADLLTTHAESGHSTGPWWTHPGQRVAAGRKPESEARAPGLCDRNLRPIGGTTCQVRIA